MSHGRRRIAVIKLKHRSGISNATGANVAGKTSGDLVRDQDA
jgi:hypothetical protein